MLKDTKTYTPNDKQVLAEDLNTFGQGVRILNNFAGPNAFMDSTGILFRRAPRTTAVDEDLGELDGQVHQMTSQLTSGWADLRLVNRA